MYKEEIKSSYKEEEDYGAGIEKRSERAAERGARETFGAGMLVWSSSRNSELLICSTIKTLERKRKKGLQKFYI